MFLIPKSEVHLLEFLNRHVPSDGILLIPQGTIAIVIEVRTPEFDITTRYYLKCCHKPIHKSCNIAAERDISALK